MSTSTNMYMESLAQEIINGTPISVLRAREKAHVWRDLLAHARAQRNDASMRWRLVIALAYKYELGVGARSSSNMRRANTIFRNVLAADELNECAAFHLGMTLFFAVGMAPSVPNERKGLALLQSLARRGHTASLYHLGAHFFCEGECERGVELLAEAAARGHGAAAAGLAREYESGQQIDASVSRALEYYRIAAEAGDAGAQFELGRRYLEADGVEVDIGEARVWLQKAIVQQHADAQFMLGELLDNGKVVQNDVVQAVALYRAASDQGHPHAALALGLLFLHGRVDGEPAAKQHHMAAQFFETAAARGCFCGVLELAKCFERGIGVEKSARKAFLLFAAAAHQGKVEAMRHLGSMYHKGNGTAVNLHKAARWLQRAAEGGDAKAMSALAALPQRNIVEHR